MMLSNKSVTAMSYFINTWTYIYLFCGYSIHFYLWNTLPVVKSGTVHGIFENNISWNLRSKIIINKIYHTVGTIPK